ncbi:carboxy terminal-processing peptidase [Massilia sp. IC2-278]|uniref:carboxy terminal-processing peptidase n=1 Tax=Massilia sp. IC2-278 TaxID=2887200 RepID=UPI001E2D1AF9|nr:carboxy terminal-processing peptidase [Massilia sp. IC2-278]MCC2962733.1 carboxy terminal-processing peptidase [Massilia sp. IC2-278]
MKNGFRQRHPLRALAAAVLFAVLPAAVPLTVAAAPDVAPAARPTAQQADILLWTARVLERYRYKPASNAPAAGAGTSVQDAYLKSLDPARLLFTEADAASFEALRPVLDKNLGEAEAPQLAAAHTIFSVWQARQAAWTRFALEVLHGPLDLDGGGQVELVRTQAPRPASEAAQQALWRQRVIDDVISLRLAGCSENQVLPVLERRYRKALAYAQGGAAGSAQAAGADMVEIYMNAYVSARDPHGRYFAPPRAGAQPRKAMAGIGLVLQMQDELLTIVASPGSLELRPDERIVGVAQGKDGAMTEVIGWSADDVGDLMRGDAGTAVTLAVLAPEAPPGAVQPVRRVTLVRAPDQGQEKGATAAPRTRIETVGQGAAARRIGVIEIAAFYQDYEARRQGSAGYASMSRDVARLLKEMAPQHPDAVLLDLRGNGGGSLTEVTALAGLFLPDVPVVQQRSSDGKLQVERSAAGAAVWDGPLGVLLDQGSAAGTEIFAAALQDHGRALVLGDTSFGRSSIQTIVSMDRFAPREDIRYGDLRLTVAQAFRVGGDSFEGRGVVPDIAIPGVPAYLPGAHLAVFPTGQVQAQAFSKRPGLAALAPALAARHTARTAANPRYQAMLRQRARLDARRASDTVTLNLAQRRREAEAAGAPVDIRQVQLDAALRAMGDAAGQWQQPSASVK